MQIITPWYIIWLPYLFVRYLKWNDYLKAQYLPLSSELQTKAPFFGASSGFRSLHFSNGNTSPLPQIIFPCFATASTLCSLKTCATFSRIFGGKRKKKLEWVTFVPFYCFDKILCKIKREKFILINFVLRISHGTAELSSDSAAIEFTRNYTKLAMLSRKV